MCFFFAQKYHTSMKYVGAIRKELGFRTVFNILGPLTNPRLPPPFSFWASMTTTWWSPWPGAHQSGRAPGHGGVRSDKAG